jgi:signal transduction histidine kinase
MWGPLYGGLLVGLAALAAWKMRQANRALQAEVEERRHAEEQLRSSEARARSFLESSPMGIHLCQLQPDGRLLLTGSNPAADRILGVDHEPLLGREIGAAFPFLAEADVPAQYRRVCSCGQAWNRDEVVYGDGTAQRVLQIHAFRTGPGSMATLFLDQTERHRDEEARRRLEEQLRQSQKLEAVGRLAGGVAHDFNNLLMVITAHGELLRRKLDSADPHLRKVQHMMNAADRASRLVRQLLAFSRSQDLDPRVLDLNGLLNETLPMLRPVLGTNVSLSTELDPHLGRVRADRAQLEQVLLNLAVNGRDAMPAGGALIFRTENRLLEGPGPVAPGPYVILTVRDTGAGMDARTRTRVFEPFFTTKANGQGTGLGLAMAYGVVQQSGGHITVESEPGRGTAFHIHLPRVEADVAAAPLRAAVGPAATTTPGTTAG